MSYLLRNLLNWLSRKQYESGELFQPSLEEFKYEREASKNREREAINREREIELMTKCLAIHPYFDFEETELKLLLEEIEIEIKIWHWQLKKHKHKIELLQQLRQLVLLELESLEQNCNSNNIGSRPSPAEKRRIKGKEGEDSNDE